MFNFNRGLLASTLTSTTSSLVVGISLLTTPSFAHKGEEGVHEGSAVAVQQASSAQITDLDLSTLAQVIPDLETYGNLASTSQLLRDSLSNKEMVCRTVREWASQNYKGHQSLLPIDSKYPMKSIIANLNELQTRDLPLLPANKVKAFIEGKLLNTESSVEPNAQLQIALSLLRWNPYIMDWTHNRDDLRLEDIVSLSQPHLRPEVKNTMACLGFLKHFGALEMSRGFQIWLMNTISKVTHYDRLKTSIKLHANLPSHTRYYYHTDNHRMIRDLNEAMQSSDGIFKWGEEILDVSENSIESGKTTWKYTNSLHFSEFAKAASLLYMVAHRDASTENHDHIHWLKEKLGEIKPDQHYGFAKKVKALINPTEVLYLLDRPTYSDSNLYFRDRAEDLVPEIIDSLVRVGSDFDDDYINTVYDLSIGMHIYDRVRVMSILSKIPPQDWSTLLDTYYSVPEQGMTVNTIDLLARIAPENQREFVNAIQPLFPEKWWGDEEDFEQILGFLIQANKKSGAPFKETVDQVLMSPKFKQDDLANTANLLFWMQVEYDSEGNILLSSESEESIIIEDDSDESWDLEYESDGSLIISSDSEESILIEDSSDESSLSSFTISSESESDENM